MLDPVSHLSGSAATASPQAGKRAVLTWHNGDPERTAGAMPVWKRQTGATDGDSRFFSPTESADSRLSYSAQTLSREDENPPGEFSFGDLIDMINPLQHIPLVNQLYRDMTGDEIRPASRIVGGTIFGGPAGGGMALVNVAVEYETGKDVAGNVVALLAHGAAPAFRTPPDSPAQRLEMAARNAAGENAAAQNLPGSVLSFADLGGGRRRVVERFVSDDPERTAGTMIRTYIEKPPESLPFLPPREPITTRLSAQAPLA